MRDSKTQTMRIEYLPGEKALWIRAARLDDMKLAEWVKSKLNDAAAYDVAMRGTK
jgi:hypothetical protein